MQTSHKITHILLLLTALVACSMLILGQPVPNAGNPDPNTPSAPSDQKPGSMLFYNIYTSSINDPADNTRFNLTNTHPTLPVTVHVFFVRKSDCTIADTYFCLTANQTISFLASEYDPGEVGFLFLVATNSAGVPITHNYLIGDEYFKGTFNTGTYFQANLGAVSFSAKLIYDGAGNFLPWTEALNPAVGNFTFNGGLSAATAYGRYFDATSPTTPHFLYDEVPSTIAIDNVQSPQDATTLVIMHSMQGRVDQAGAIGTLAGLLYNDTEKGFSYQVRGMSCVEARLLNDAFIRVPLGLTKVIPSGRSGWIYFNSPNNGAGLADLGLLGASIVTNPKFLNDKTAFNGGHNMHFLTIRAQRGFAIPVIPTFECRNF